MLYCAWKKLQPCVMLLLEMTHINVIVTHTETVTATHNLLFTIARTAFCQPGGITHTYARGVNRLNAVSQQASIHVWYTSA